MANSTVTPNISANIGSVGVSTKASAVASSGENTKPKQEFAKVFSNSLEQKQKPKNRNTQSSNNQQADKNVRSSNAADGASKSNPDTRATKLSDDATGSNLPVSGNTQDHQTGSKPANYSDASTTHTSQDQSPAAESNQINPEGGLTDLTENKLNDVKQHQVTHNINDVRLSTLSTSGNFSASIISATQAQTDHITRQTDLQAQLVSSTIPAANLKAHDSSEMLNSHQLVNGNALSEQMSSQITGQMMKQDSGTAGTGTQTMPVINTAPQLTSGQATLSPLEAYLKTTLAANELAKQEAKANLNQANNQLAQQQVTVRDGATPLTIQAWQQLQNQAQTDVANHKLSLVAKNITGLDKLDKKTFVANNLATNPTLADAREQSSLESRLPYGLNMYDKLLTKHGLANERIDAVMSAMQAKAGTNLQESLANELRSIEAEGISRPQASTVKPVVPTQNFMPLLQLSSHINQPAFGGEVSQKLVMMVNQNIQQAQLQLNPKHLGPMEVKISVGQDQQVNVLFTAQHAAVREALDGAASRLRDMLEQQGFNLNEFTVSEESRKQHQERGQNQLAEDEDDMSHANADELNPEQSTIEIPLTPPTHGLVDYFA